MILNKKIIHLEISSKCTLKCPRCPRTELKLDNLNREISLTDFEIMFPAQTLADIEMLILCGDIGDPIYASDFLDIIKYTKEISPTTRIKIVTNGSYKNEMWWTTLGSYLCDSDLVEFSIDGWDQTSNNLYRVNSNFNSIVLGIRTLRATSKCFIRWSTIYFNFNEEHINEIKNTAISLGCDEFVTVKSTKFDGRYLINNIDNLKPNNIAESSSFEKNISTISFRDRKPVTVYKNNSHWAKCVNYSKEMYVSVEGYVYPCSWMATKYQENFMSQYNEAINLKKRSLNEILYDDIWQTVFKTIDITTPEVCRILCKGNNG